MAKDEVSLYGAATKLLNDAATKYAGLRLELVYTCQEPMKQDEAVGTRGTKHGSDTNEIP